MRERPVSVPTRSRSAASARARFSNRSPTLVPSPIATMAMRGSLAAVAVLQAHHIGEMRCGSLEDIDGRDCFHPMHGAGPDAETLSFLKLDLREAIRARPNPEPQRTAQQVDRLVLVLVVL